METRRSIAARLIQKLVRSNRVIIPILAMAIYFVNPYLQALNLSDKSHFKSYTDGGKGLEKELKFDGKRAKFNNFSS